MSIAAANVAPNFGFRQRLSASDLQRIDEPCVIFEHHAIDSDMHPFWVYTVGGILNGRPLQGATVGGDVITISGVSTREQADAMASLGLLDTLQALDSELQRYREGQAALTRLESVSPIDRLDLGTRAPADKSDAFERDMELIQPLKGEDILLSAGRVAPGGEATH